MWYELKKFLERAFYVFFVMSLVTFLGFVLLVVTESAREGLDPRGGWCIDHATDKDGKKFSVPVICDSPLRPGR